MASGFASRGNRMKGDAEQHDTAAVLAAIECAQAAPDAGFPHDFLSGF